MQTNGQDIPKIAVAVDGPAGAGKSSVSKAVARRLGYVYIDTGAMYRAVTYFVIRSHIEVTDEQAINASLNKIHLQLLTDESHQLCVLLNGENVTAAIRTQQINDNVSIVASYKKVRAFLVKQQRAMAEVGGVILDGRDIGSVVLPHADLKIYLTASVDARAERRWLEMPDTEKGSLTLQDIKDSISHRDYLDTHRDESPLTCAEDAIRIDSSTLTFEETVDAVYDLIVKAARRKGGL